MIADPGLRHFLDSVVRGRGTGRLVVTSRFPLADIEPHLGSSARSLDLPRLSVAASLKLLGRLDFAGDDPERRKVAVELGGHPLALRVAAAASHQVGRGQGTLQAAGVRRSDDLGEKLARLSVFYLRSLPPDVRTVFGALSFFTDPQPIRTLATVRPIEGEPPLVEIELEVEGVTEDALVAALEGLEDVRTVHRTLALGSVFGKRIIVVGGGAQVAQVALGAVSEADRHNLRGERISVDTIPLVGEPAIAAAVRAVADLPRARLLVLAGSIMGGDISVAADELRAVGIPIIALNMVGSITEHVDLVVSDPVQAGTMAVMAVADTATFDLERQRGRRY